MRAILCSAALAFAAPAAAAQLHDATPATAQAPFRRGINILAHDPFWKDPAKARFQAKHFAEIRRGGFDFVRVNLLLFDHMDAQNRIDPEWLKRLDWVVVNARNAGLGVILDVHSSGACRKDVAKCRLRLSAAWRELAGRYRAQPSSVAFELLNEPDRFLDAQSWDAMVGELLPIIRASNPTRTVIIAPKKLEELRLPPGDRNIIVTLHHYSPFRFTHQGARWTKIKELRGVAWGSPADRQRIRDWFDRVGAWADANQRPILIGEFGVYDRSAIPVHMRADYSATVVCEAERRGFGWAYWQFDGDFIAWDMKRNRWVEAIKEALIPRRGRAPDC